MLYVTTRSDETTYTAYKTLTSDFGPDGGAFVPFRFTTYSPTEIFELKDKSVCQTIADILNMFFSARIDPEELDLRIGRNINRIVSIKHKIAVAELWHNLNGDYAHLENILIDAINNAEDDSKLKDWPRFAIRVAVLFAVYGDMLRNQCLAEGQPFDVSITNDDLRTPLAALYCKAMGLPINKIICACADNSNLWDFIHRGTMATTLVSPALSLGVERLLQCTLGCSEAKKFHIAYTERTTYAVSEDMLTQFNSGLFCSIAGEDRAKQTINSVYRSCGYVLNPVSALSYSGLQDYRAKTGNSEVTLILEDRTPKDFKDEICDATGIRLNKLNDYIDNP